MRENQIKAVHQRDLQHLLKSLGVYEAVRSKAEACYFCHEIVSEETISAVFPLGESVCFCCENPGCCNALLDMEQEDEDG